MAEQMNKTKLLNEMRDGYAAFENLLAPLSETQVTTAGVNGEWSIKDILAHLAAWQKRTLNRLDAAVRNEKPSIPGLTSDEEMHRLNDQFYQENKARPLTDVLTDFRTTYSQILDVIQAAPEEVLIDPQRFTWLDGAALWELVAGNTYEHYQEHTESIQQWLSKGR